MIFKLFSQRNKAKTSEPLSYDIIPQAFRVQVVHILQEAVTDAPITRSSLNYYSAMEDEPSSRFWEIVFKSLTKELGVFKLNAHDTHYLQVINYVLQSSPEN
ncbi:MAG: hypothetical protein C0473_01690 [Cyanobacteria bacterium DS3.002]|nr:hypothetical protein [Cyanobacteria bacterium DS3.002]MBA4049542.1 hypothetical protein [Cyanobacteria bacterium DS2.008]